jgi:replication initiation protein RepC
MKSYQKTAPDGAHSLHNATGQGGCVENKWQLLRTIEDIREPLGLKGTSISLLRAMISFLRVDQVDATRDDGHICFASNASLAKRAHVSIQTVERHIAKLVALGLLTRRSSGNGKRWARRDRQGKIVLATGLSLLPLAERHPEFVQMSQAYQDQKDELGRLRDMCAVALANLKSMLVSANWEDTLFAKARTVLKRQPEKTALNDLLTEITVEISRITPEKSEELRTTAPEIEGHKDTSKTQYVEEKVLSKIEVSPDEMQRAYPRLCSELRFSKSQEDCHRLMDTFASQLSLGNTWFAVKDLGPTLSFMVLGYLLERVETVNNHRGYAFKLAQDLSNESIDWRTLLKRPKAR